MTEPTQPGRLWHRTRCSYAELEDRLNSISGSRYFSVIDIMPLPDGDFCLLYIDTSVAAQGTFLAQPDAPEDSGIEDADGSEPLSKLNKLDEV